MIDPNKIYSPSDEALRQVAAQQTFAKWRHEKTGPKYMKAGSRVLYRGSDILDWLASKTVEPAA